MVVGGGGGGGGCGGGDSGGGDSGDGDSGGGDSGIILFCFPRPWAHGTENAHMLYTYINA